MSQISFVVKGKKKLKELQKVIVELEELSRDIDYVLDTGIVSWVSFDEEVELEIEGLMRELKEANIPYDAEFERFDHDTTVYKFRPEDNIDLEMYVDAKYEVPMIRAFEIHDILKKAKNEAELRKKLEEVISEYIIDEKVVPLKDLCV